MPFGYRGAGAGAAGANEQKFYFYANQFRKRLLYLPHKSHVRRAAK